MNKAKRMVQAVLAIGVILIGIYMWWNNPWLSPPSISGVGFFLAGLALWVPHCPVMHALLGDKTVTNTDERV
ncbi:hypothetical protein N9L26_02275 [Candidatus Pacebacteria bacterium]|nr:hypothetical protein [Candidatus Paceibacterota bacterium]